MDPGEGGRGRQGRGGEGGGGREKEGSKVEEEVQEGGLG